MDEAKGLVIGICAIVIISVGLMLNPIQMVGAGEQAVVFNKFNSGTSVIGTGINWVTPVINKTTKYSVKVQKNEFNEIEGLSSDSQTLKLNLVVNWRLDGTKLVDIFKTIQGDVAETIMYNAVIDTSKAELGKFGIGEIARNREILRAAVQTELAKRLAPNGIIVTNVSIANVDFNKNYESAIEQKMIAEQQAMEAKNLKLKVQYESEAKAIENRNLSATITPLVLQQKWIEALATGKIILPQTMVINGQAGGMSSAILNLPQNVAK